MNSRSLPIHIRQATPADTEEIASVLLEASRWTETTGTRLWRDDELSPSQIAGDVAAGLFFIAISDAESAGVMRFQLDDELFWPDISRSQSAFVHRLAVRRRFAGRGISTALLNFAVERARSLGKDWLRLDCEAARPKLRAVYERFGFRHHSDRQAGPYYVSRYEYPITSKA